MGDEKLVIFRLGNEWYGVDIAIVEGIEKMLPIVRIPNSVAHIQGVINLRGNIIPVYSLRNRFGLPDAQITEDSKFLITLVGRTQLALLVDGLDGIYDISEEQYHETPIIVKTEETAFIRSIALEGKRLVMALDTNYLLSRQEQDAVNKIIEEQPKK